MLLVSQSLKIHPHGQKTREENFMILELKAHLLLIQTACVVLG